MQHFQRINVSFYEKVTTVLATTSVKRRKFFTCCSRNCKTRNKVRWRSGNEIPENQL